jgi:hypothetical protein
MDDHAVRFWQMYESKEIQAMPLDFRIKLSMSYSQWRIDWYDKHNLHAYWMKEAKEGR